MNSRHRWLWPSGKNEEGIPYGMEVLDLYKRSTSLRGQQTLSQGVDVGHPKINIDGHTEHEGKSSPLRFHLFERGSTEDRWLILLRVLHQHCYLLRLLYLKVNYSCEPNCIWVYKKSELQLRAVKNVWRGEELTVAYDAYMDSAARCQIYDWEFMGVVRAHWTGEAHRDKRDRLKMRFEFNCLCTLCAGPQFWPISADHVDMAVQSKFHYPFPAYPRKLQLCATILFQPLCQSSSSISDQKLILLAVEPSDELPRLDELL